MSFFQAFDAEFCQRLVVSLGHSLWQGVFIAGAVLAITFAIRRRSSQARYVTHLAGLLLLAACVPITFSLVEPFSRPPEVAPAIDVAALGNEESVSGQAAASAVSEFANPGDGFVSDFAKSVETPDADVVLIDDGLSSSAAASLAVELSPVEPLGEHLPKPRSAASWWLGIAPGVVAIYLAGVLAMFVRVGLSLYGAQCLRMLSVPVDDSAILTAVARQTQALGLKLAPPVAFCRRVAVPTVVGVLRPVILIPLSFATSLSLDEIETLLAHELAHIRRWDPWVNLIQRVLESLLFFNPAVWMLSRFISVERENCCDDLVVQLGAEPSRYAESLVRLAELSLGSSPLPAATMLQATGNPSKLSRRVERLLGIHRSERMIAMLDRKAALVAALPVVVLGLIAYVPTTGKESVAVALADATADATASDGSSLRISTPSGVEVELVGVSSHPSEEDSWWRPDGTRFRPAPYDEGPGLWANDVAGEHERFELAVRFHPLRDEPLSHLFRIPKARVSYHDSIPLTDDVPADEFRCVSFRPIRSRTGRLPKTIDVQLGFASDPWRIVKEIRLDDANSDRDSVDFDKSVFPGSHFAQFQKDRTRSGIVHGALDVPFSQSYRVNLFDSGVVANYRVFATVFTPSAVIGGGSPASRHSTTVLIAGPQPAAEKGFDNFWDRWSHRVTIIDRNGKSHSSGTNYESNDRQEDNPVTDIEPLIQRHGVPYSSLAFFDFPLPVSDIASIVIEARPITWVEFQNVSLHPDAETSPKATIISEPVAIAKPEPPHVVVERWLEHVKRNGAGGNWDESQRTWDLTTRGNGVGGHRELYELSKKERVRVARTLQNDLAAMVYTNTFSDNSGRERVMRFYLQKKGDGWLIDQSAFVDAADIQQQVTGFQAHPGTRYHYRVEDLAGRWLGSSQCDEAADVQLLRLSPDGTFEQTFYGGALVAGTWKIDADSLTFTASTGSGQGVSQTDQPLSITELVGDGLQIVFPQEAGSKKDGVSSPPPLRYRYLKLGTELDHLGFRSDQKSLDQLPAASRRLVGNWTLNSFGCLNELFLPDGTYIQASDYFTPRVGTWKLDAGQVHLHVKRGIVTDDDSSDSSREVGELTDTQVIFKYPADAFETTPGEPAKQLTFNRVTTNSNVSDGASISGATDQIAHQHTQTDSPQDRHDPRMAELDLEWSEYGAHVPLDVKIPQFFSLGVGPVYGHASTDPPTWSVVQDASYSKVADENLVLRFHGIHTIPLKRDEGIELWNTRTAAEHGRIAAGFFGELPFEGDFVYPIRRDALPLTINMTYYGLMQVTEVAERDSLTVRVRYKLMQVKSDGTQSDAEKASQKQRVVVPVSVARSGQNSDKHAALDLNTGELLTIEERLLEQKRDSLEKGDLIFASGHPGMFHPLLANKKGVIGVLALRGAKVLRWDGQRFGELTVEPTDVESVKWYSLGEIDSDVFPLRLQVSTKDRQHFEVRVVSLDETGVTVDHGPADPATIPPVEGGKAKTSSDGLGAGADWGTTAEGVAVRLRANRTRLTSDENITVSVDIHNHGASFAPNLPPDNWLLEWDGESYLLQVTSTGIVRNRSIGDGESAQDFLRLRLVREGAHVDVRRAFDEPGTFEDDLAVMRYDPTEKRITPGPRIPFSDGKHNVRVGFPLHNSFIDPAFSIGDLSTATGTIPNLKFAEIPGRFEQSGQKTAFAYSQPVEIEISAETEGSSRAAEPLSTESEPPESKQGKARAAPPASTPTKVHASPEDLARQVFESFKTSDITLFLESAFKLEDVDTMIKRLKASGGSRTLPPPFSSKWDAEELVYGWREVWAKGATVAGVNWEHAVYERAEYDVIDSDGIKGCDVYLFFSARGKHFQILLDDCYLTDRGWLAADNPVWMGSFDDRTKASSAWSEVEIPSPVEASDESGPPLDGVSLGIHVEKLNWDSREIPSLEATFTNHRPRHSVTIATTQRLGEIEVDGVWYQWGGEIRHVQSWLEPGKRAGGIRIVLTSDWKTADGKPLALGTGTHTIRFAGLAQLDQEHEEGPELRLVSNPVSIQIFDNAAAAQKHSETFKELQALSKSHSISSTDPVRVRILDDFSSGSNRVALSLLTGQQLALPADFADYNERQRGDWFANNRIHLLVEWSATLGQWHLLSPEATELELRPVHDLAWDFANSELIRQIHDRDWGEQGVEWFDRNGYIFYPLQSWQTKSLPVTHAFRTRPSKAPGFRVETSGLLQVTRADDSPRSLEVRWKLIPRVISVGADLPALVETEFVVNDDNEANNMFVDLDSGELYSPPETLGNDEVVAWARSKGIDAVGETADAVRGLGGFDLVASVEEDHSVWDTVTVADLLAHRQLIAGKPTPGAVLRSDGLSPKTYWISTREGSIGLLQLMGLSDDRSAVNVRCKLLQPPKPAPVSQSSPLPTGAATHQSNHTVTVLATPTDLKAVAHPASNWTFSDIAEVILPASNGFSKYQQPRLDFEPGRVLDCSVGEHATDGSIMKYSVQELDRTGTIVKDLGLWDVSSYERWNQEADVVAPIDTQLWGYDCTFHRLPASSFDTIQPTEIATVLNNGTHMSNGAHIVPKDDPQPTPYAFRTRQGTMGVALLENSSAPRGVKITYRLVRVGDETLGNTSSSSIGAQRPDEAASDSKWSIGRQPDARLVHGWISFDTTDGELAIREHVGGGTQSEPLSEPLELHLQTRTDKGFLLLDMIRRWSDKSARIQSKTSHPKGAAMRVVERPTFLELNAEYQVLWRADFIAEENMVKSVAYVARLSPVAEQYDGFSGQELDMVKAALLRSEASPSSPD